MIEAGSAQAPSQEAVAATIVENTNSRSVLAKLPDHLRGVAGGTDLEVIGIYLDVTIIVDEVLELGFRPIIKAFGEQEAAACATMVVDWNSQRRQLQATQLLAGSVEIDLAIELGRAAANFARPCVGADRSEVDVGCHRRSRESGNTAATAITRA
jgi:hypothetical protein